MLHIHVFASGGLAGPVDVSESGYFAVRAMLGKTLSEVTRFIAERGVTQGIPSPGVPRRSSGDAFWQTPRPAAQALS
jgi:hypothetical protein